MKAAVVKALGRSPEYDEFPDPRPQDGETRVTVSAAALSQLARARASGAHYSSGTSLPFIAGIDGVGRLDDGRRVYFLLPRPPLGAMAEWTLVPDRRWLLLPDSIDDETAAVIANPGVSSWAALVERARIRAGETVLVNGATGASGRLAVRIARHLGAARVFATGRNQTVLDGLGADATIPLGQEDAELENAFGECFESGVDIVLDYLWGPSARTLLIAAAKAGHGGAPMRFVQIGSIAGEEIALAASVLRSSTILMMGSGLGSVAFDRIVLAIKGVFGAAASAGLSLDYCAIPLSDVAETWAGGGDRRIVYTNNHRP